MHQMLLRRLSPQARRALMSSLSMPKVSFPTASVGVLQLVDVY